MSKVLSNNLEVINFGCRLNIYEGEVIKQQADAAGLSGTLIFNSCAVTAEAERQVRQAIRKAHKENPKAKIIVTGCGAQINPKQYADMPEVNSVIGNEEKLKKEFYTDLSSRASKATRDLCEEQRQDSSQMLGMTINNDEKILVNDIMSVTETASHMVASFDGKARAFVQVQNGCDHRCTFCIIPYGRGNSRSVPMGEIVAQVRSLVEAGYNEVVLTGVDISDYGKDLPSSPTLGQMCRRLLSNVPNLKRLRLSSIDAVEVDDDLLDLFANEPRLMPHIHISLQAGDDMVLKRMKRRHNRQNIIDFCAKLRELRSDIVFGADIIAGFPTETDEMFANTLNLVKETGLIYLHVFPYSARSGTPAAKMPQVAKAIRKERAAKLREVGEENLRKYLQTQIGKEVSVLMEKDNIGKNEYFTPVTLDKEYKAGTVIRAEIRRCDQYKLYGNRL
ncbi:MAG: tRNA (N(6)-L-threonylcarbamoyladenosine(37)-C(2))-methylthiotransferase MtaB [Rickettsiales bacterium]